MRFLLDTHVLVWWLYDVPRLSPSAFRLLSQENAEILVSAVSAFEIANKFRLGKWQEIAVLAASFDTVVDSGGFTMLPVTNIHASCAGLLAGEHRDPFDRLIAAQAQVERLSVVSADAAFDGLGAVRIW